MHIYKLALCSMCCRFLRLRHGTPPPGRTSVSNTQVPDAFLWSGFIVHMKEVLEENVFYLLSLVQLLFGCQPQV